MKNQLPLARAKRKQGGYALLLVVFFTTLLLVGTMSIGLRILTEGRREKEQEMIWRGKQYTRGIKLYYRKMGRFPTSMDDLVKPKIGNLRFMRQTYKDPMNKEDGSWRLIYVGPAGQLIGSLKQQNSIQIPGALGQPQTGLAATGVGGVLGPSSGGLTVGGGSQPSGSSFGPSTTFGSTTGTTTGTATGTGPGIPGASTTGTGTDSQPVPSADTPTIVGGNIIGVGSKIDQSSVIVYETAKNYRLFEFIWDPSKEAGLVGAGTQIGTPAGTPGAPGQNPIGSPTTNPTNPTNPPNLPNPTPPSTNPPQQQP
jgi:hypothetical protein